MPFIVIELFDNLPFAIEPANIAFVIPPAFTLSVSEFVSIELSSTFTASDTSPDVPPPDRPSPLTPVISAVLSLSIVIVHLSL